MRRTLHLMKQQKKQLYFNLILQKILLQKIPPWKFPQKKVTQSFFVISWYSYCSVVLLRCSALVKCTVLCTCLARYLNHIRHRKQRAFVLFEVVVYYCFWLVCLCAAALYQRCYYRCCECVCIAQSTKLQPLYGVMHMSCVHAYACIQSTRRRRACFTTTTKLLYLFLYYMHTL